MMFHETGSSFDLNKLSKEIMDEHDYRLDVPQHTPLTRKPFRHRPRPQTAIISRAAQEAHRWRQSEET